MPRYIDVEKTDEIIEKELGVYDTTELKEMLSCFPTADVEPVRHGRWIRGVSKGWPKKPSCLWYCSCCGEKIRYIDTLRTYQKSKKPVNEVNPRCRKCGAKMDKKEDKNENNKDQD